jgi:hypothetical protein
MGNLKKCPRMRLGAKLDGLLGPLGSIKLSNVNNFLQK